MSSLGGSNPDAVIIRPASEADLPAAARIKAAGDLELSSRLHPLLRGHEPDLAVMERRTLAQMQQMHAERPEQIWVAEAAGEIVGEASALCRERHAHILSFFVLPTAQQHGIGGRLLTALLNACRAAGCTVITLQASDDPRAMTHYLRQGFHFSPPNVVWSTANLAVPPPDLHAPFAAVPITLEDESTLQTVGDIDKAVRGVRRLADLRNWLRQGAAGALFLDHASGKPAGYALCSVEQGAGRIGPVAAIDLAGFAPILRQALAACLIAFPAATHWRLATPGENSAAIPTLLAANFRPVFTMPFLTNGDLGQFDRYAFHDLNWL